MAGTLPIPGASAYCMSTAAQRPLAQALELELAGSGVSVTLLTPGYVVSELRRIDHAGVFQEGAPDPVPAWLALPAERAAEAMLRAIRARCRELVITRHGRVLLALWHWAPWLLRAVGRRRLVRVAGGGGGEREGEGRR